MHNATTIPTNAGFDRSLSIDFAADDVAAAVVDHISQRGLRAGKQADGSTILITGFFIPTLTGWCAAPHRLEIRIESGTSRTVRGHVVAVVFHGLWDPPVLPPVWLTVLSTLRLRDRLHRTLKSIARMLDESFDAEEPTPA